MAIRDRLSRIVGKAGSSSGSSTGSNSSSDSQSDRRYNIASSSTTSSLPKTPKGLVRSYTSSAHSRLSKRTTAWLSTTSSTTINLSSTAFHHESRAFSPGSQKPDPKRSSKHTVKSYHPSERRLNERNLRHQEILGSFTMKFGRRRFSQSARSEISEVSPGNSRAASLDIARSPCQGLELEDREGLYGEQRRMSSLVDDSADLGTIQEFDSWAVGVLRMLNYEE